MLENEISKLREHQFRELLQNLPAAVQGYRPDGTVLYWNFASEKLYGFSAQEAIGKNLLDLIIPSEIKARFAGSLQRMLENGIAVSPQELTLVRKDGARVEVYSSMSNSLYFSR